MPSIEKILFPVDFSGSCVGAARYVEAFAGRFEAAVMLLHVADASEVRHPAEVLAIKRAQLDTFLINDFKYFSTDRLCVTGDPATVIAEEVRAWHPDLVMLPTHGLGYF